MKIGTAEILRNMDKHCIEELKIPGIVLMENAALKVLKHLETNVYNRYCVVCGSGNNGGDGFAIARHLKALDKTVEVFLIGSSSKLSEDCRVNYQILKNLGMKIQKVSNVEDFTLLRDALQHSDIAIDSLFGTGLSRNLDELYVSVISIINENSKYIVAVDIPSGMDSNTGEIKGNAVKAKKTVSFELYKRGFISYNSHKYTGEIVVESIGMPKEVINLYHEKEYLTSREEVKNIIPKREKVSHKGSFGRVLVIAGSEGYTGASYITTQSAVRSGAGLVTLGCSYNIQTILSSKLVEAMTYGYRKIEDLLDQIKNADVIALGPGLGNNSETLDIIKLVLNHGKGTLVIDADGINVLSQHLDILKSSSLSIILTPHPGEMARLTNLTIEYINENRMDVAKNFAKENSVIVVLKGYNTVISDGKKIYVNPTGTSAMASGGMGDCLTGIIASLAAQGCTPLEAACASVYIHGFAGDKLSHNMYNVNAEHIIEELPYTLKELEI